MSREDRIETIRSEVENGQYLTDEKIAGAADEIQRELCGCSSRRTRDSGLIIAICFVVLAVAVLIWAFMAGHIIAIAGFTEAP